LCSKCIFNKPCFNVLALAYRFRDFLRQPYSTYTQTAGAQSHRNNAFFSVPDRTPKPRVNSAPAVTNPVDRHLVYDRHVDYFTGN